MSLDLDPRRHAMLAEFGIKLWLPEPPPTPLAEDLAPAAALSPAPAGSAPAAPAPGAPAPVLKAPDGVCDATGTTPGRQARPVGIEAMDWSSLQAAVAGCRACKLCESRRNTVFGVGDPHADWLIVGEAPGENEDRQGEPFVGPAGHLLDNMLKALGLDRHTGVYIANVLKCRPPSNRNPEPEEVAMCEPYLKRQVELLQPKIILAMGRFAVQSLLQSHEPIGKLRGRPHAYHGVPVVVTYHPAYLLRNLGDKAKAWADLCLAQQVLRDARPAG